MWGYILFLHVTDEGWERRGGKGEGGCREISFRIVCQNIIPFSLNMSKTPQFLR